jgi:SEL1 protein
MFHLGYNYLKGRGVPRRLGRAWSLLKDAGFTSRHAALRGPDKVGMVAARILYEARLALVFMALGGFVMATGGKGIPGVGRGGGGVAEWQDEAADDEFDDFD